MKKDVYCSTLDPDIDTDHLIGLIQSQPQQYRLEGATKLRLYGDFYSGDERFSRVSELLKMLAPKIH